MLYNSPCIYRYSRPDITKTDVGKIDAIARFFKTMPLPIFKKK
jgi:hypothetical protein